MTVTLNHTIVHCEDRDATAAFYADLLGVATPTAYGPFLVLELANEVSLDFLQTGPVVHPQHYAFLVSEDEFESIFGRIQDRGLEYWADPFHQQPGRTNDNDGGRGVYWEDPNGHNLEIITRPYGSGG
jgi:catechol 2,3-dioxygenase-like lactoylglutathione lyase family enzyme